jgi:hypothetical protein
MIHITVAFLAIEIFLVLFEICCKLDCMKAGEVDPQLLPNAGGAKEKERCWPKIRRLYLSLWKPVSALFAGIALMSAALLTFSLYSWFGTDVQGYWDGC